MLILPKYTNFDAEKPKIISCGCRGEVRLKLRDLMGRVVQDTGWTPNLITDRGLYTNMRAWTWPSRFHVGTNATAPSFSDTSLYGWLDEVGYSAVSAQAQPTPPTYHFSAIRKGRFNSGSFDGTVSEVGLGPDDTNTNLSIRTTVTPIYKSLDNVLDVYYKFTRYPDLTDRTGTALVEGNLYDYTLRPYGLGTNAGAYAFNAFDIFQPKISYSAHAVYLDDLVPYVDAPTGNISDPWSSGNPSNSATGTNDWDWDFWWDLDRANHASGFRNMRISSNFNYTGSIGTQLAWYRQSDNARIQKTNAKRFYLTMRYQWFRYP